MHNSPFRGADDRESASHCRLCAHHVGPGIDREGRCRRASRRPSQNRRQRPRGVVQSRRVIAALPIGARRGLRHHRGTANEECPSSSAVARLGQEGDARDLVLSLARYIVGALGTLLDRLNHPAQHVVGVVTVKENPPSHCCGRLRICAAKKRHDPASGRVNPCVLTNKTRQD